jgi:hypothetical protein
LAIMVIAHPEANPMCGASVRTNNRRHDDFGRPLRRYATMAAPTSGGIGIRARCRPLARTSISLARQFERERRDLVGPQAELGQQQQNGVVAPSHHRLSVATVESLPHLCGRQIGRQSCELPSPHRWNAIRQRARVQPPMVEVTEKGAQRPAHRLACSRAPILGVALNVADHVLLVDFAQGGGAAGAHLVQKPADDREMAYDGPRGQAAL